MSVLKERTESLCPVCLDPVPARLISEKDRIYLEHQCPAHGSRMVQAERDEAFFKTVINRAPKNVSPPPYLTVFPTYRCNINCNVCYVPRRDPAMDMNEAEISTILDQWPYPDVFYAGGEPTVMEKLPDIIALTKDKGKRPFIVSNGIRLADSGYVKALKRSGLQGVSLSLNALDRKILETIDGRDYLDEKMSAITNMKRYRLRFGICFSLIPGVNESEFGKVLWFAFRNYPFTRLFHAECLPDIGRGLNSERLFLSDMFNLLATSLKVEREFLIERAFRGKGTLGPYGFAADVRDVLTFPFRDVGILPATLMFLTKLTGIHRPELRMRVISGPLPDCVDLEETWSASTTMAVSKENPMMVLWEYLVRCHGKRHGVE